MRITILMAFGVLLAIALPLFSAELCIVPSENGVNVSYACDWTWRGNFTVGFGTEGLPCGNPEYVECWDDRLVWSISASAEDPFQNVAQDVTSLYLWYVWGCGDQGFGYEVPIYGAEFGVSGDIKVLGFTPIGSVENQGTTTNLRLAMALCPVGPVVVGEFAVETLSPVTPTTWGRIKAGYW